LSPSASRIYRAARSEKRRSREAPSRRAYGLGVAAKGPSRIKRADVLRPARGVSRDAPSASAHRSIGRSPASAFFRFSCESGCVRPGARRADRNHRSHHGSDVQQEAVEHVGIERRVFLLAMQFSPRIDGPLDVCFMLSHSYRRLSLQEWTGHMVRWVAMLKCPQCDEPFTDPSDGGHSEYACEECGAILQWHLGHSLGGAGRVPLVTGANPEPCPPSCDRHVLARSCRPA
jgi:hypothetical protein